MDRRGIMSSHRFEAVRALDVASPRIWLRRGDAVERMYADWTLAPIQF